MSVVVVDTDDDDDDELIRQECQERMEAELEFVSSAYGNDEAWIERIPENDTTTIMTMIHRRFLLEGSPNATAVVVPIRLTLLLPPSYPKAEPLQVVDARVEQDTVAFSSSSSFNKGGATLLQKAAHDAMPFLLEVCRSAAIEQVGEESVFVVLNAAEEWMQDQWPLRRLENQTNLRSSDETTKSNKIQQQQQESRALLGRRLIYSHHIIAKKKRADIKTIAADYKLTGYMKIGWPGLLIIEGEEEDCNRFYDEIRPWSWQYLVIRGEQQEVVPTGKSMEPLRRFANFMEVDDMSVVAEHCKEVGLEALFRTSMKKYEATTKEDDTNPSETALATRWYGALILVDHMNDGKGYRKWLRKSSLEVGCFLFIKQIFLGEDHTNRPKIYVGVIGDKDGVFLFLKRWRTSRVDVDSKGKACLERQMKIIAEEELAEKVGFQDPNTVLNWELAASEGYITVSEETLAETLALFGWTID